VTKKRLEENFPKNNNKKRSRDAGRKRGKDQRLWEGGMIKKR